MSDHPVVSGERWLEARQELLKKEKEFTRLRDELTQQRRNLPWEKVEKEYVFEGPHGEETLAGLFGPHSQLVVYHFMFAPDWPEGCKICSMFGDHYDPLTRTVRLTPRHMETKSLASLVVAAHEVGHALQDAHGWEPFASTEDERYQAILDWILAGDFR